MKPKLLVVELHHLGDAVISLPFVRGALEKFDVHVLCRPATASVYGLLAQPPIIHSWNPPWAEEVSRGSWKSIEAAMAEGRALHPQGFAAAVCVWADARAAVLMAATGSEQRIGFPMTSANYYGANIPWRRKNLRAGRLLESLWRIAHLGRALLTTCLHRVDPQQPHSRCWEQIAEALGVACDYSTPWVLTPEPSRDVADLVSAARTDGKKVLVVHTNARLPSKQWPRELWRVLLRSPEILSRFTILELLPPKTDPLDSEIHSVTTQSIADLAGALSAADAVLCHDSFPAHLAAALGKPVMTIFGSGQPDWFAPWQNRTRAVQRHVCPLHPCLERCAMDSYLCLDAVSVEDVQAMINQIPEAR